MRKLVSAISAMLEFTKGEIDNRGWIELPWQIIFSTMI
jgi:hypothetical protein